MATTANDQSAFLGDYLKKPVDLNNETTEARLFELGRKRLDPVFAEQQDQLSGDLANKGIMLGSKQYETANRQQYERENDAYNQLLLGGRGQAVQEALTQRNQPINEITALLSGSQVDQPNFLGANLGPVPTTDVAGLINKNYDQQLGLANFQAQQVAQKNALGSNILGGLFSLGSGFLMSDRRAKTNIRKVGRLDNGLDVYAYRYIAGGPTMIGVMAQDVESVNPDAVVEFEGVKYVDYDMAVA